MAKDAQDVEDVAGVVAPPPLIFLGFLVVGLAIGHFWPLAVVDGSLPVAVRIAVGTAVAVLSLAMGMAGLRQLRRAGTNVRPDRPTTALVRDGIYRYSRNPLYTALAFLYAGIAFAADSLWALMLLVPALLVIRYGVIAREEAYLERRFGDDYRNFTATVRRWL
ncbi:MAG TPA: isoprenylcysteine carboxylmethyltransferase family protein [Stellaceae bacterium]|nr:isoprenylcysteine carboxylmethyltransferase family protein [Stellaceae bacterium]